MYKVIRRKSNREKRKLRVRKKVFGTSIRPRLSIFRSNKYIYAQVIDDENKNTLVSVGAHDIKEIHKDKSKIEAAHEIGKRIAELAKSKGISQIVFDRNGYRFHGRVKGVAEGAKEGGLIL